MLGISVLALLLAAGPSTTLEEGIALFQAGQYKAAEAHFREAHADTYLALAQAASGDCKAALPALTGARESGEVGKLAGIAATRCLASTGDTNKALAAAEALKQRYPADADVLYVSAEAEMRSFNETTELLFKNASSSYRVHQLSARVFETQNRFSDAVSEYRKAIELAPTVPDLHFRLGRASLLASHGQESLTAAQQAFQEELRISPEDSACEFQLGQIAQVQGKSAEAKQHFEAALRLSPSFVSAMVALASLHAHEREYPAAIALLQKAVALQPENEGAHYALLTAYRNAGDRDGAAREKETLDKLQKPASGEFSDFLKKLGETPSKP